MEVEILLGVVELETDEEALTLFRPAPERRRHAARKDIARPQPRKIAVEAVAGVDLTVRSGEIFGFLGPNGAGKTTTLRMLARLLPPSGGKATVAGCDLLTQPDRVRKLIGYVSQAGGSDYEVIHPSDPASVRRLAADGTGTVMAAQHRAGQPGAGGVHGIRE